MGLARCRHTYLGYVTSCRSSVRAGSISAAVLLLVGLPAVARADSTAFRTTRTFQIGAGRATRTFTFRERGGVILVNRLTVPHGARVIVEARIPGLAGARVSSRPSPNDPSLSCRRDANFDVCTQGEEWCPMPGATWHFHLVKLSGPAGAIRFDFVVAVPPKN